MKHKKSSKIDGLILFTPNRYHDERGYFQESFNTIKFYEALGKKVEFVQDNLSYSKKGVFRGIHLQNAPHAQAKLVQVIKGSVVDFAVDLRPSSPTYLKWEKFTLSDKNRCQLWIPEGFGHAFLTTSDYAYFSYKTTNFYNKNSERCIRWDDPKIQLQLESLEHEIIISEKDSNGELV